MPDTLPDVPNPSLLRQTVKFIAVAASTGAALVTVLKALYSYGVIGEAESHESIGNIGAAWVGLRPAADTATSVGDTLHFAATITDRNGSILVGARPVWTTGDVSIATVLPDGSVIARGKGSTTVTVVVGSLVADARVVVKQLVTDVRIAGASGDSALVVREGAKADLHARALDARGYVITGMRPQWRIDDSSVATLDSGGALIGRNAGRTVVTASIDGVSGRSSVVVTTTAASIAAVAGMQQTAPAGRTLQQPIVVRVTNRRGAPASGQVVTFRVRNGQGSLDLPAARTDADGRARTIWTLGDLPGRQTLFASVENVDSAIAISADADPVASNTRITLLAEQVSGRAGEATSEQPAVRVTDSSGRALPDVMVRWSAPDGGSVTAVSARTDSIGVARARWTLSKRTGTQRLRAEVGGQLSRGIAPVTITATARSGAPASIAVVGGEGQRASAGSTLPKAVVFRVLDRAGNGVSNAALMLSPSGGTVPSATIQTDANGTARTRWTLGHSAGEYTMAVHVDGIRKLLKVPARAAPAAAANLSFEDAPVKSGTRPKTHRLSALVTDVYGNPVPDAKLSFSVKSGTVTPARAVSGERGRVSLTWTPGSASDEERLSGSVSGTDVKGAYIAQLAADVAPRKIVASKASATKSQSRVPPKVSSAPTKTPAKSVVRTQTASTKPPLSAAKPATPRKRP